MRFLIVRTDIRTAADDDLVAIWAGGGRLRDEQTAPEHRRQIARADDRDAALVLARALSTVGAVRSGRQRVKVVPLCEPEHRSPAEWQETSDDHRPTTTPHRIDDRRTPARLPRRAPRHSRLRRPMILARDRRGNDGHGPRLLS